MCPTTMTPPWMPQPMQQLLFTFGPQQAEPKWGNEVGSLWLTWLCGIRTFSPYHPGRVLCRVESTSTADPVFNYLDIREFHFSGWFTWFQTTKGGQEQIPSTVEFAISRSRRTCRFKWNVLKNLNVSYVISPFLLAQRLWSFLVLKKKQNNNKTRWTWLVCLQSLAAAVSDACRRVQTGLRLI